LKQQIIWLVFGIAAAGAGLLLLLGVSGFADIPCQDGRWHAGLKTCIPD
jgi:hypothetical protein